MARKPPGDIVGEWDAGGRRKGARRPPGASGADAGAVNGAAHPNGMAHNPPPDGAPLPAAEMPYGFEMRDAGVYALAMRVDDPPTHVCGRLEVIAMTRDSNGEDWGKLLRWTDDDGQVKEWSMPVALLAGDGMAVRERLMRGGLFVGTSRPAREALGRYLMLARPAARIRVVDHLGWHETPDGPVFVLPSETISAHPTGAAMRLQTEHPDVQPPVAASGTLAEWQREVAALAVGNSRLMLALSAAFAAPLLEIVEMEGGGVHFVGQSSKGKTRTLELAGSVWGRVGKKAWVQSWNLSPTAMEAAAAAHSDLPLCLDEISEIQDPKTLGPMAYSLANGMAKGRGRTDGSGRGRPRWRVLFLSTGEQTLSQAVSEDPRGRRATAGQAVRVVDISADGGAGHGLFENLHGAAGGQQFSHILAHAVRSFHGTAGPEFLRRIIGDRDAVAEEIKAVRADFLAERVASDADGQVKRVAERFALIGAAGAIAAAKGILPFGPELPMLAAARCFADWRQRRGGDAPSEFIAGIAQVRRFLEVHEEGRFQRFGVRHHKGEEPRSDATGRERVQLAGFRREGKGGTEFFVLPETWKAEVAAGFDAGELANEMVRRNLIRADPGDGKPQIRCSLPGRPGGARAYHILPAIFVDD